VGKQKQLAYALPIFLQSFADPLQFYFILLVQMAHVFVLLSVACIPYILS